MNLTIERPLAVLDVESTGLDPAVDRVVEVAAVKFHPGGRVATYGRRVNPTVPIPPAATAVHGITDADAAAAPPFAAIAKDLFGFLAGCDLAGFAVTAFDLPLLAAEFARAGLAFRVAGRHVLDAFTVYRRMEPRNLAS